MARPHFMPVDLIMEGWITDLSPNKRHCKLLGYNCVATFDISPEALWPLTEKILAALVGPEAALDGGRCNDIDIGLYGPDDIRAWSVLRGI